MLEGHFDIYCTPKLNVGWTCMGPIDDTSEKFVRILPIQDDGAYLTRDEAEDLMYKLRDFLHRASDHEFKKQVGYLSARYPDAEPTP